VKVQTIRKEVINEKLTILIKSHRGAPSLLWFLSLGYRLGILSYNYVPIATESLWKLI
jgi:hypothetical protein